MIRRARIEKAPEVINGFRMRGTDVSRLEAFVDIVFGFGLTLLVVSSQVPNKFEDLLTNLRGFVPFTMCFAIFFGIWSKHYAYCRRFGLEDGIVRFLTVVMMLVMLVYLYPLKFLANIFCTYVLRINTGWKLDLAKDIPFPLPQLFILYGVGFALIQIVFYLLYARAYSQRVPLKLDELETLDTRWWMIEQIMYLSIPTISIFIALTVPSQAQWAGYIYFAMGLVGWLHGWLHGTRHREMVTKMEAQGRLSGNEMFTENDVLEVKG